MPPLPTEAPLGAPFHIGSNQVSERLSGWFRTTQMKSRVDHMNQVCSIPILTRVPNPALLRFLEEVAEGGTKAKRRTLGLAEQALWQTH